MRRTSALQEGVACMRLLGRLFRRRRKVVSGGTLTPNGRLVARKISQDETESIRVVDRRGRSSEAEIDKSGNLSHSITGPSPRGEEGSLDVCSLLVERLNKEGSTWGRPFRPDGADRGVDCVAEDHEKKLHIQVTRIPSRSIWRKLAMLGSVGSQITVGEAAQDLFNAIQNKQSIPPHDRPAITLAIDSMDNPGHATPQVVKSFRRRYAHYVDSLGFSSVWVVGPVAAYVLRLDKGVPLHTTKAPRLNGPAA